MALKPGDEITFTGSFDPPLLPWIKEVHLILDEDGEDYEFKGDPKFIVKMTAETKKRWNLMEAMFQKKMEERIEENVLSPLT